VQSGDSDVRLVRFILVFSVIAAAIGRMAHAQARPKAPWAFEPESTTPISVPADIRRAVGFDLEYEEAEPINGVAVDLNGDDLKDYLLRSAQSLCGTGGCMYVLCDGASRRKLGEFFGSPLIVRTERVHGYPDIATYSHQSSGSGIYTKYSFDGSVYVVTSKQTLEGAAVGRLFETLRRIPVWRPRP